MHSSQRALGGTPQPHVPAAPAAGAQLEKAFSGSVATAAAAAAAREADRPTGKKERGPQFPKTGSLRTLRGSC